MIEVNVITTNETEVSAEKLYELRKAAFQQWTEAGLSISVEDTPMGQFKQYLTARTVFVAQEETTGELLAMHTLRLNKRKGRVRGANLAVSPKAKHEGIASRMLQEETQRLRKAGYRYMIEDTAIPATWSVRWHLKNGYCIVGYSRSEHKNYASYIFRKQIAFDVRHYPTDLLWMRPIALLTAKIQFVMYYLATNICKTRTGRLNWMGRLVKKIQRKAIIR